PVERALGHSTGAVLAAQGQDVAARLVVQAGLAAGVAVVGMEDEGVERALRIEGGVEEGIVLLVRVVVVERANGRAPPRAQRPIPADLAEVFRVLDMLEARSVQRLVRRERRAVAAEPRA